MGYYPNASKTNFIVKPQFHEVAIKVFKGTGMKVTTEGHEMLSSTISATSFAEEYTSHKVKDFAGEIETLSQIAERYRQSAYAAFPVCSIGKWRYTMRIEDIDTIFAVRRCDYSNICSSINWWMSVQS